MRAAGEPSVEEILESIKKVIARDNRADAAQQRARREAQAAPAPARAAPRPAAPAPRSDVLDLSEVAAQILADDPRMASEYDYADELADAGTEEAAADDAAPLIPEASAASMRDSLAALAMLSRPGAAPQIVRSGETSLEGLVRDMLRPMLADWLDHNLPPMVERMVAVEIARIVGKRG